MSEAEWKANSESWARAASEWQKWATGLLHELGRQPLHGEHGSGPAREIIGQLARLGPPVSRCDDCGCFATVHEVDDEELRDCTVCECEQFWNGGKQ